ncbi:hypothetical protein BDV95DRAFT_571597 [Massariosphaeria phaeospora]|uniref:Uncharacterized protein n=1 Tax=Massariosphaeria phaeospora TaxID=100035 RepID=A0A7C8MLI6_9PLEO|nr:hypothetical protein BDV95DRAFT_571597 [Massariosphaeria phaeospora]
MTSFPLNPQVSPRHLLSTSQHIRLLTHAGIHLNFQLRTRNPIQIQIRRLTSTRPPKMSWMDSWSRPSKHSATPPPLYLTTGSTPIPYCHSCGRVIGQRKSNANQEVKYCSARCRNSKPRPVDRRIEAVFTQLLNGASPESLKDGAAGDVGEAVVEQTGGGGGGKQKKKKAVKGDPRVIVECDQVEAIVFPRDKDPAKVYGRRKNRAARGVVEDPEEWRSVDMVDDPAEDAAATAPGAPQTTDDEMGTASENGNDVAQDPDSEYGYGGGKVRPPQSKADVNGSVGGEKGWAERIEETEEMKAKRLEGKRRVEEREMVRRAARRGVAFGFAVPSGEGVVDGRRKCEAIRKGVVVEPSFAKGEWGIRWREKE